jgi:hypothetical protein
MVHNRATIDRKLDMSTLTISCPQHHHFLSPSSSPPFTKSSLIGRGAADVAVGSRGGRRREEKQRPAAVGDATKSSGWHELKHPLRWLGKEGRGYRRSRSGFNWFHSFLWRFLSCLWSLFLFSRSKFSCCQLVMYLWQKIYGQKSKHNSKRVRCL